MATFDSDISVSIYKKIVDNTVGHNSVYTSKAHPGTNKKIEGWKWDKRFWPTDLEFESAAVAPSIWDPSVSGIDEETFQSGYGDNKDLKLLDIRNLHLNNTSFWAPQINHGYYYINQDEWYLYSEAMRTEYFDGDPSHVSLGNLSKQLNRRPKPTIPISVTQYRLEKQTGGFVRDKAFQHRTEFTASGNDYEFLLENDTDPPTLVVSGIHVEPVGSPVVILPDDIDNLEIVGISSGEPSQNFSTTFSPIANFSSDAEVWVWKDPATAVQWTIVEPDTLTSGNNQEVELDTDRGVLSFGDYDATDNPSGSGAIPANGSYIGIYYNKGVAIEYEPEHSVDYIIPKLNDANVNPIRSASQSGFIQVSTESIDPASIELTSDLIKVNPFLINLGNNIGRMFATVKSSAGTVIEGQSVTFELIGSKLGSFGATAKTIQATTRLGGVATALYNSPASVSEVGAATTDIVHDGADTVITVSNISDPGTLTGLTLYKIHEYDEVLGIPTTSGTDYYTDYFEREGIEEDPDGTAATQDFEETYRENQSLQKPTLASDLSVGKKTIIFDTTKSNVMNPHTGKIESGLLSPLYPDSITNIGTADNPILELRYNGVNLPLILSEAEDRTKGYFIVGDGLTELRAFVVNKRTGQKIVSETIQLRIQIPDTVNGNFFADALNDVPQGLLTSVTNIDDLTDTQIDATQSVSSLNLDQLYIEERLSATESYADWFRRTRRSDTALLNAAAQLIPDATVSGINIVDPDSSAFPSEIPLGFRVRSSNVTLAAVLDQVTFLEGNSQLPDDYYSEKSKVGILGNSFTVI